MSEAADRQQGAHQVEVDVRKTVRGHVDSTGMRVRVLGRRGQKVWVALNASLVQGLDHVEVLSQGGGDALRHKLGLCLGKPSADPARPELNNLKATAFITALQEASVRA